VASNPTPAPSAAGMSDNTAGMLAYITIIPAIVFLVMEPYNKSKFVRFHAFQCIFLVLTAVVAEIVLGFIPIIGWILLPFVGLGTLVAAIICLLKANQGQKFKLPVIGDFAEKQADAM
jgi:uncharacterized membrane protein